MSKSCPKVVQSCQKVVIILSKSWLRVGKKLVKISVMEIFFVKKLSKSCQKAVKKMSKVVKKLF
jgi:hypothetical protein